MESRDEKRGLCVGDSLTEEVCDSIRALEHMGDIDGCLFQLDRLESLSFMIESVAEGEGGVGKWGASEDGGIGELAFWQRNIVDAVRTRLDAQGRLIMRLHQMFNMTAVEPEKFEADAHKLEIIRELPHLFPYPTTTTDLCKIRAWAGAHGMSMEAVSSLLALEPDS